MLDFAMNLAMVPMTVPTDQTSGLLFSNACMFVLVGVSVWFITFILLLVSQRYTIAY
jgi:hypothetical protein